MSPPTPVDPHDPTAHPWGHSPSVFLVTTAAVASLVCSFFPVNAVRTMETTVGTSLSALVGHVIGTGVIVATYGNAPIFAWLAVRSACSSALARRRARRGRCAACG